MVVSHLRTALRAARALRRPALLTPVLLLLPACDSLQTTLCDLQCECEHCNDLDHDLLCERLDWMRDVSASYDCEEQWEDWGGCVESEGTCDEVAARFSTEQPGSCSVQEDSGFPCDSSADCSSMGPTYACDQGTCWTSACAGTNDPCTHDSDCPTAQDRCEVQRAVLSTCLTAASDSLYVQLIMSVGQSPSPPPDY